MLNRTAYKIRYLLPGCKNRSSGSSTLLFFGTYYFMYKTKLYFGKSIFRGIIMDFGGEVVNFLVLCITSLIEVSLATHFSAASQYLPDGSVCWMFATGVEA